jgi:hypothetical protein
MAGSELSSGRAVAPKKGTEMKAQRLLAFAVLVSLLFTWSRGAAFAHAAVRVDGAFAPIPVLPQDAGTPPSGWWASVQEDIRRSEYHVTWQEQTYLADATPGAASGAYQAPNRAHNLRTYFLPADRMPAGIRVLPRSGDVSAWEWSLAPTGYGYQGAVQPVSQATQSVSDNRVEYRRAGLIEWYVNGEHGVEQGFTLVSRPPGSHDADAAQVRIGQRLPALLSIEMALAGDLIPQLGQDRAAIEFTTRDGVHVLRYGHLYAFDAAGRSLDAYFDLTPVRGTAPSAKSAQHVGHEARALDKIEDTEYAIRILVDDTRATYPITIDPLITSPDWTVEGEQVQAYLGASVGTAGDVDGDGYDDVIVGAPRYDGGAWDTGRASVYLGSASGLAASAAWTAYGQTSREQFGSAVGTAGDANRDGYDEVIVGAIAFEGSYWWEGRAYVFDGSPSGLSATPDWTVQGGQTSAGLGCSVGTAGDVNGDGYDDVIVGALGHHDSRTNAGRAYVYHGSASGLSQTAAWTVDGSAQDVRLGTSVGTAGDVNGDGYDDVIVGAPGLDGQTPLMGKAYIYHGSRAGLGSAPDWTGTGGQPDDRFGFAVGTAGDVDGDGYDDVIVGAPGGDEDNPVLGQVSVYYGSSSGVSTGSPDWTVKSEQEQDHLGSAVSTAGDVDGDGYADLIIGAPRYDGDQVDEGQARVYYGSASGPRATPDWTAQGDQNDAWFGAAVSTAGDINGDGYADVLVGAPYYDTAQENGGRAFLFYGPTPALDVTPGWTADGDPQASRFGYSVSTAGDVNGDGYSDIVIGAPRYDGGQSNEGRAYLYLGAPSGVSSAPAWWTESDQANAYLGETATTAGDVNGDGYDDVIVGAGAYDNGQEDEGRAYLYHGSAAGLGAEADWTAEGDQAGAQFGLPVGTAGDVNGDGYADVLIGARTYDGGQTDEGRVYVYHGSASGLSTEADWTAESDQIGAEYGFAANTAGDINGDGYTDVVVGAPYHDSGQYNEGRVYVYYGSPAGLTTQGADWVADSNQARADYGCAVGTAGDVNGDGYADLIVGAPRYNGDLKDEGQVYVYYGSSAGLSATVPNWTSQGDQLGADYGRAVGTAGDLNGDGYADVVIGAPFFDTVRPDEGRAFAYYGGPAGLSTALPDWAAGSDQSGTEFGTSVGTAGDVNGDGYADLIVGAPYYKEGQTTKGRAYVYYGASLGQGRVDWTVSGGGIQEWQLSSFGASVHTAGDVNGDGYADVIMGAPGYDAGLENQGRVHVYLGSAAGLSTTAYWTATGEHENGWFGISVGTAGDVNGDGYSDVIAGETGRPFGNDVFKGRAYAYHGSPTGPGTSSAWRVEDNRVGTLFGRAVSTAGDVNGDGYADVIVGAPDQDTTNEDAGQAYVYLGSSSGLSGTPGWTAVGGYNLAKFGQSAATAGDVNGDGYSDVIVGAPGVGYIGSDVTGRAHVYLGSASGLGGTAAWAIEHNQVGSLFGAAVGTAGDVNGDGFADVIVGAPKYSATEWEEREGQASVYLGSPAGLSRSAGWVAVGARPEEEFGRAASTAGDVNGDGYADVIVGAPHYTGIDGRAYVYHGSPTGLADLPAEWTKDYGYESYYGDSVGTAGDVNGDGYADVVIGAPGSARAYVRYGSGPGLGLALRQRRADDSAPIAHLGQTDNGPFRLAGLGRTPFGRSKVKLEWEVKPLGTPFDGLGTGQGAAWIETGVAGAQLNELVGDLQANTAYHWRVRLRYHPATTPYQQYSRWLTVPWNGWNEQDVRTGLPGVGFGAAAYSVLESDAAATITVTLDMTPDVTVTVGYATADGTATAGEDYTATSGTLTFAPGERTQTFDIALLDDSTIEGAETVALILSEPVNAAITGLNPVTLTIVDQERHNRYLPILRN